MKGFTSAVATKADMEYVSERVSARHSNKHLDTLGDQRDTKIVDARYVAYVLSQLTGCSFWRLSDFAAPSVTCLASR